MYKIANPFHQSNSVLVLLFDNVHSTSRADTPLINLAIIEISNAMPLANLPKPSYAYLLVLFLSLGPCDTTLDLLTWSANILAEFTKTLVECGRIAT
jgi:hypothetical protein